MNNNKMSSNCENCGAFYEPYKVGESEDASTFWCELPNPQVKVKGLCQFCNPKSKLYVNRRNT